MFFFLSDYEEGSKDIDRKVKLDTEDIEVESFMDGENKEAKYWDFQKLRKKETSIKSCKNSDGCDRIRGDWRCQRGKNISDVMN